MKLHPVVTASSLLWTAVVANVVPLQVLQYIADNVALDDATRQAANFSYHHTQQTLQRRHQAYISGGAEGVIAGGDDSYFDHEQSPNAAASLDQERAALYAAVTNQTLEPNAYGGAGQPGRMHRRRGDVSKRQSATPDIIAFSNTQSCETSPPLHKVRQTGTGPAYDRDVNQMFENMQNVADFYADVFERNSFDGNGGDMFGTVHHCYQFNDAVWDGEQMLVGDGDGYALTANIFPTLLSVIAHEFTHGVISSTNPLFYYSQTGALNEHLADVFGVLAEQYTRFQTTDEASWLLGENLIPIGQPLRSFIAPGTAYFSLAIGPDRQVANMSSYYTGPKDNQGVHVNSGILNHAFYLFSQSVGGYAFLLPGHIWYQTMIGNAGKFDYKGETFTSFAQKTIVAAFQLEQGNDVIDALRSAYNAVGIYP